MNLQNKKVQLTKDYVQFMTLKRKMGMDFYKSESVFSMSKNFLNDFRETKKVFVNGVLFIKSFHYLYLQCVSDYLELYLREKGFVNKKSYYYQIADDIKDVDKEIEYIISLVEEGLIEAESCLTIELKDDKTIDKGCIIAKRILLQKVISVLALYDFEKYVDKYVCYAEEAAELGSIQAYSTLVLYYTNNKFFDLSKAREAFDKCISIKIDEEFKINELAQVSSKITAYSYMLHGYLNAEKYDEALEIIKLNRQYLVLEECNVLDIEAKDKLFLILESFISYIKKKQSKAKEETYEYDVFISYSSFDSLIVDVIINKLEELGLEVWRDINKIRGGNSFVKEIPDAIKKSRYFLVILTPEAENSSWIEREIIQATNNGKEIIPYKIGNYDSNNEIKFMLGNIQIINQRNVPIDKLAILIQDKIKSNLGLA